MGKSGKLLYSLVEFIARLVKKKTKIQTKKSFVVSRSLAKIDSSKLKHNQAFWGFLRFSEVPDQKTKKESQVWLVGCPLKENFEQDTILKEFSFSEVPDATWVFGWAQ